MSITRRPPLKACFTVRARVSRNAFVFTINVILKTIFSRKSSLANITLKYRIRFSGLLLTTAHCVAQKTWLISVPCVAFNARVWPCGYWCVPHNNPCSKMSSGIYCTAVCDFHCVSAHALWAPIVWQTLCHKYCIWMFQSHVIRGMILP